MKSRMKAYSSAVFTLAHDGNFILRPEGGICLSRIGRGPEIACYYHHTAPHQPSISTNFTVYSKGSKPVMSHCRLGCSKREMGFAQLLSPSPGHSQSTSEVDVLSETEVAHRQHEEQLISNQLLHLTLCPLIAITCPGFVSNKLQGSEVFVISSAASLQTVRCPQSVWFPTLTLLPFQFIFCNSRRLLGFYNVTLMR